MLTQLSVSKLNNLVLNIRISKYWIYFIQTNSLWMEYNVCKYRFSLSGNKNVYFAKHVFVNVRFSTKIMLSFLDLFLIAEQTYTFCYMI